MDSSRKYVFLDFAIDSGASSSSSSSSSSSNSSSSSSSAENKSSGSSSEPHRVVIELFTDKCPKTCDNFLKVIERTPCTEGNR